MTLTLQISAATELRMSELVCQCEINLTDLMTGDDRVRQNFLDAEPYRLVNQASIYRTNLLLNRFGKCSLWTFYYGIHYNAVLENI